MPEFFPRNCIHVTTYAKQLSIHAMHVLDIAPVVLLFFYSQVIDLRLEDIAFFIKLLLRKRLSE